MLIRSFIALTLGCTLALPAAAQELTGTMKKIKDTGTLTVGYRESSIPFSYLDDKQQPVGYAMELCGRVIDAVKAELKMPALKIALQPVTSSNRIPLLQNGTIDMECGSTTNSVERQKTVSFSVSYFVTNVTAAVKKSSGIKSIADLNGKPVSTTSGSTSVQLIKAHEKGKSIDLKEIYGKDHAESFLLLSDDRVSAFVMDDILIAGFIANAKNPADYVFLPEVLRTEPYGIMLRKDDTQFKALADKTLTAIYKSGEINKIYSKWFQSPIPPKNANLNFPVSKELAELFKNPNDAGVK
jgi:glutamate/aspartate transport system substrate-binding protein